ELETQLTSLRVQFVIKWTDEEARLQSVECLLPFAELEPEARDRLQCLQVVLVSLYQGVESFCCPGAVAFLFEQLRQRLVNIAHTIRIGKEFERAGVMSDSRLRVAIGGQQLSRANVQRQRLLRLEHLQDFFFRE